MTSKIKDNPIKGWLTLTCWSNTSQELQHETWVSFL